MKPEKASNPNKKEWPSADQQFSEHDALKALMTTLPEVDGNGGEAKRRWREEKQKPIAKDKLEWMKKFHLIFGQTSHYRE